MTKRKKILIVIGTRPEAIKMSPLFLELKNEKQYIVKICSTSQHKDLLNEIFSFFKIKLDFNLHLMKKNQKLDQFTSLAITGLTGVYEKFKPDLVLVHGDTSTAFAASVSAFYLKINIGHVEAGLRSGNMHSPFPEEFNRKLIGKIANFHFCPSRNSKNLLLKEGVLTNVFITGNTVIDALKKSYQIISKDKVTHNALVSEINKNVSFNIVKNKFILITCHRRENFGKNLNEIFSSFILLAKKYSNLHFIYPVHPNPNIKNLAHSKLSNIKNFHLTSPQSYQKFILLLKYCYLVITDSGGIQEEAPAFGKPVIILRENSERPECIVSKCAILAGHSKRKILSISSKLIESEKAYNQMSKVLNPYGNGNASNKIIKNIKKLL